MPAVVAFSSQLYKRGLDVAAKSLYETTDMAGIDLVIVTDDIEEYPGAIIYNPDTAGYRGLITPDNIWPKGWVFFEIWRLDYDVILTLQTDQLFLKSVRELLEEDNGALYCPRDAGFQTNITYKNNYALQTTMMTVRPKMIPGTFDELVSMALTGRFRHDMQVINEFAHRHGLNKKVIPPEYILSKRYWECHKDLWNLYRNKTKSVHYCGADKPWMGRNNVYKPVNDVWLAYEKGIKMELPEA